MTSSTLALYHRLPPIAQSMAASMRGMYLRQWRYGPETDRLVEEAVARERWSADQWQRWREDRLARILHRAATAVPFYRDYWAGRGGARRHAAADRVGDWPLLTKEDVRRDPRRFVADDCDPRKMFHEHTSGTSATPLDLWWSRETVRRWYALFEARWRLWYGVSRHDRWAILGGQLVAPFARRRPPFWVWNAPLRQLYLSSYHLAPELIPSYLEALRRHRVEYLWGYTSSLYALATTALDRGERVPMKVVITNAEPLDAYQRDVIGAAFGCAVRETYSMAEIVMSAGECLEGRLHIWPEVGIADLLNEELGPAGRAGDLVATGLFNADMPLIRYAVGDRVSVPVDDTPCPCGRTLPALSAVEGRDDDVLFTPDGRPIGRLDPAFKASLPIHEAQIVQEAIDRIRVRYVPVAGRAADAAAGLQAALANRLGGVDLVMEEVSEIPRTASGKFRAVVCALPADLRGSLMKQAKLVRPA